MSRSSATPYGPSAPVEDPQLDRALPRNFMQSAMRFVYFPGAGQHTAVLVRVGVAEHHFLTADPGIQEPLVIGRRPQSAAYLRAGAQVFDRLEQRHRH